MRRIAAHYIYCGNGLPVKFGVITLNGEAILEVSSPSERMVETAQTEFYPGVIIPGIVNAATAENNAWYPQSNDEIKNQLANSSKPSFALITPDNLNLLEANLLLEVHKAGVRIALGSYASNHPHDLFKLTSMLALKLNMLDFASIVTMATYNGSLLMGQTTKGLIARNYAPGIYSITGFCFDTMTIGSSSRLSVLIN